MLIAYPSKVSTTDALLQYVNDITSQIDNPAVKYVQGACLDFSKALLLMRCWIMILTLTLLN